MRREIHNSDTDKRRARMLSVQTIRIQFKLITSTVTGSTKRETHSSDIDKRNTLDQME
jgi:hypothetical protein